MADGSSTITLPIPPEALARLKAAELRQRNETRKRGLTAVPVSVEGLLLIQKFLCGCGCGLCLSFCRLGCGCLCHKILLMVVNGQLKNLHLLVKARQC